MTVIFYYFTYIYGGSTVLEFYCIGAALYGDVTVFG